MKARAGEIGFSSRQLRLRYLEYALELVSRGDAPEEARGHLDRFFGEFLADGGATKRGSRQKLTAMLLRIWVRPPEDLLGLRDAVLALGERALGTPRLVLHWGMTAAAYPFWGQVAEIVGRLFRLQETASTTQIRRRVQELVGDREIVARATRCVLRSFVDWHVLEECEGKGAYRTGKTTEVSDPEVVSWLLEACLRAKGTNKAPLKDLVASPMLFPFRLEAPNPSGLLFATERVEVIRHGFDEDLLGLRS